MRVSIRGKRSKVRENGYTKNRFIEMVKVIHFLLSVLCLLLMLSRLIRATISVFFVPSCPVLLSFYLVLSYMFELNKWRWRWRWR